MRLLACSALLASAAVTAPAAAQETIPDHAALRDRFYFGLGGFFPKTTTTAQLDSTRLGTGANIDFENALGMQDSKSVPVAIARWRITERWRVEGEYFQLNRTGDRQIDRTIQWGDTVYPVNAQLHSKFDFSDFRISGGYSFFKTKDKELGVGLGFHVAAYDVSLTANAIGTESQAVTAPLPVVSAYGQFALTDRWAVAGRMDRFALKYNNYDGSVSAIGLDILYQPFKNVGFGLGSRSLYISLEAVDGERTAKFKQTFQGPLLFVTASF
jgi:hypothetical protein